MLELGNKISNPVYNVKLIAPAPNSMKCDREQRNHTTIDRKAKLRPICEKKLNPMFNDTPCFIGYWVTIPAMVAFPSH